MRIAAVLGGLLLVLALALQFAWPGGGAGVPDRQSAAFTGSGPAFADRIGLGGRTGAPALPAGAVPPPSQAATRPVRDAAPANRRPWSAPAEFAEPDVVR